MKRKSFWTLLAMMLLAVVSVGFVACSDDDDEGSGSNPLVGKWEGDHSESYWEDWTFNSNGSGEQHTDDGTMGLYNKFKYAVLSQETNTDSYYGETISGQVQIDFNSGRSATYRYYKQGTKYLSINGYSMTKR